MEMSEIINESRRLNMELNKALCTMTRKNTIYELRTQLIALQKKCPHSSNEYNLDLIDGHVCPYCGKNLT